MSSAPDIPDYEALYRVAARRALASGDATRLHLHFHADVLQRYRDAAGFSIVRTDTVGRVKKQGGWSLDFGIAPDEDVVHVPFADLVNIPEAEREHWAGHAAVLPSSRMFVSMRMTPGSCFDDGKLRPWDEKPVADNP